jgi:hypothetical protein
MAETSPVTVTLTLTLDDLRKVVPFGDDLHTFLGRASVAPAKTPRPALVEEWIETCATPAPDGHGVRLDNLYASYLRFVEGTDVRPLAKQTFGQRLAPYRRHRRDGNVYQLALKETAG